MDLAPSPSPASATASPITSVNYVSSGFTVAVPADLGKVFTVSGTTLPITLPAASSAGAGFYFWVHIKAGSAYLQPNAGDTISEASGSNVYLMQNADDTAMVICAGSPSSSYNWLAIGSFSIYKLLNDFSVITAPQISMYIPFVDASASKWKYVGYNSLFAQHCFAANRNNSNQTGLTTGAYTKIAHTTKVFDPYTEYDASTNYRYTPLFAGKYLVYASAEVNAIGAGSYANSSIFKNGALYARNRDWGDDSTNDLIPSVTSLISMNGTTDYLEHFVYHTKGSNATVAGDVEATFFGACWVST